MVADVTERRRAELGRERAEQRYQAVVESLNEGLIVLGLDGRILSANASVQRILGRTEEEMLAPLADAHWSFVDVSGNPIDRLDKPGYLTLRDGEPRTGMIIGVHRPDGELRWIEENTRPLRSPEGELEGVVLTLADVTERFEADRRVRAERDFTRRVLDTIADGVLVTDELPDGGRVIVHVNDRICEITGFARDELLGARTPFPWWPEDRHAELAAAFEQATASGAGEYEARFQRRDGAAFPAVVSVGAVHLVDAEQRAWVITVKDLSQRNALLDELQVSRKDMERVLDSVEEYLYTYELAPDGTSSLVRELSRPVARVLDVDASGCVGTDERWLAATHPDDRAGVSEAGRRLLAGRPVDYEHRVRDRDGCERWVWVRERPERASDGRLFVHGAMTDVTARKEAEGQLGEALEEARRSYAELSALHDQMRRVVGSIDELFYTDELRADGAWHSTWIGENWRRFIGDVESGQDPQEIWDDAVHPDDRERYHAVEARILALEAVDVEYRLVGADGEIRWVWERMRPSGRRVDGTLVVDGVVQDITERKRSEERLEEALALAEQARAEADLASRTDPLTGLANRRHFAEQLGMALDTTRPGQALGLLLLDIDHFKRTNDTYGHAAGDAVLREVARQLAAVVRAGDIVARIGGEELAVVMPGGGKPEVLRAAGERVRMLVAAATVIHDECEIPFTVSVGAASSLDATTADTLLAAADRAMYAAKRRGRDRVCLFCELVGDDFLAEVPEALRIAEALALTVSVREGMPALHNQQVAELAGGIARELELAPQAVLRCQVSGWLHDIGKTAIPDSILSKPERAERGGVGADAPASRDRRGHRAPHRRARRRGLRRAPPPRALGRHGVSGSSRGRGDLPRGPRGRRRRRVLGDHVAPAVPARAQPRGGDRGAAGERRRPPRSAGGRGPLPCAADADEIAEGAPAAPARPVRVATRPARRRRRTPACSRSARRESRVPRASRHLAVRRADRSRPSSCRGPWPARGRGTGSGPRAARAPAARRAPARSARGRRGTRPDRACSCPTCCAVTTRSNETPRRFSEAANRSSSQFVIGTSLKRVPSRCSASLESGNAGQSPTDPPNSRACASLTGISSCSPMPRSATASTSR